MTTALIVLAALTAAGLAYQAAGSWRDRRRVPPPGQRVDIGNRRLHLFTCGDGSPAVLFEAGIAASSLSWRAVQQALSAQTRTYAYDRAGYGWSDARRSVTTAASSVDDLLRLIAKAPVPTPFILVAHSYGAYVARLFAAARPDLVAGLVLVDPIVAEDWTSAPPGHTRRRRGAILFSHVGAILASVGIVRFCLNRLLRGSTLAPRVVVGTFGTAVSGVVRRLVGEVAKLSPDLWPAVRAHWSRSGSFLTMARHLRGLPASAALVAGIDEPPRCPVIVLAGASATDVQRARLEALAAHCPRGRLVVAARGGHWIHLDEPDLVANAIEQVIEDLRR